MAAARPELLFVRGPQEGERAVLMTNTALVGRAPGADVRVQEPAASREHLRFEWRPVGWVMENLSGHGTRVNGKRYRKKLLLLETGDVLGVGTETEILYVSPGDDPEEALRAYRESRPQPQKPEPAPAPAAEPPAVEEPPDPAPAAPDPAPPTPAEPQPQETPDEEGEEAGEDDEAKTSRLKIVLLGIVLGGLVLFSVAMIVRSLREEDNGGRKDDSPARLTAYDIREAIETELERSPSRTRAAEALDRAVRGYANRVLWGPGDHYRCVKDYQLHLAYKEQKTFRRIQDERNFKRAREDLVNLVKEKYSSAWTFERARSYRGAWAAYQELLRILPVPDLEPRGPVKQVVVENVIEHINFVKSKLGKVRD